MKTHTVCKFCGKPITVEINDEYMAAPGNITQGPGGDPYKLKGLSACDRCSDFRERKRVLFSALHELCNNLAQGLWKKEDDLAKVRKNVQTVLEKYIRLLCKFQEMPVPEWDDNLLDAIMRDPVNYGKFVSRIPAMIKPVQRQLV